MPINVQDNSLFEIDRELDFLLDEIQEQAESENTDNVSPELMQKFQQFCEAYSEKVDRIGHFLSVMEARAAYCRGQADRLTDRARSAENKVDRTKNMVLYFLKSRELRRIEGREFTLRLQKNCQDSVHVSDLCRLPRSCVELELRVPGHIWEQVLSVIPDSIFNTLKSCVRDERPCNEAIKLTASRLQEVPGAEVKRGIHLRVA